jgi:hypothetical protein
MAEIIEQGELSLLGTILATGTASTLSTKVVTMRFYNPLAYVLTIERYDAVSATSEVLYEFNLAAGDTVSDTLTYALKDGDKLTAYSDIAGTTYYIYGLDYATS